MLTIDTKHERIKLLEWNFPLILLFICQFSLKSSIFAWKSNRIGINENLKKKENTKSVEKELNVLQKKLIDDI